MDGQSSPTPNHVTFWLVARPSLVPIQLVTGSRRTMIVHWPETGMFTCSSYYTFLRFHNLVRTSTLLIPTENDILKVLQLSA